MAKKKTAAKRSSKGKDPDLKKLGERIKALRIKLGFTNYEYFAYERGISRSQYGEYEKGRNLTYSNLLKVIRALGVTPKEFFSEGFE